MSLSRHPRTHTGSLLGSRVAQWTQRGLLDAVIQTGNITLASVASNTATITAVDPSRSILFFLGQDCDTVGPNPSLSNNRLAFTNPTTITAFSTASSTNIVNFAVVQFQPGIIKTIQRGIITITGTLTSGTDAITAVNTGRAYVMTLGFTTSLGDERSVPRLTLTNATTVTANRQNTGAATTIVGYQVIEFL